MVCQCNALYMEQAQTLRCVPSTHEGHKIELSTIGLVAANTKFTVSLDVSNRQYSLNLKAGLCKFINCMCVCVHVFLRVKRIDAFFFMFMIFRIIR